MPFFPPVAAPSYHPLTLHHHASYRHISGIQSLPGQFQGLQHIIFGFHKKAPLLTARIICIILQRSKEKKVVQHG